MNGESHPCTKSWHFRTLYIKVTTLKNNKSNYLLVLKLWQLFNLYASLQDKIPLEN
jgi:hypothetical protein